MIDTATLIAILGLVGMVIVGGALLSGPVERTGMPSLAIFLLLGLLIGPYGLNLFTVMLEDPLLRVVATLSLTLVLFTDALTLDLSEVRRNKLLAALILGPGTLIGAFALAWAAWAFFGLDPVAAVILGAAIASTDPVILRGMLQSSGLSERLRLALRLESGMNDVLLLPIVLVALAFGAAGGVPPAGDLARLMVSLFVLGPLAGVGIGFVAVRSLVWVRTKFSVRREYEALYVIGVALCAFAAAEALGGSGFLAAFAAGLVISSLDMELCDCFLEYGQVTAEMALLFTYVLLGTAPIWSGLGVITPAALAFVILALVVRLPIFAVALIPSGLTLRDRLTIGWYGPRGLGSLLLALLAVFVGLPAGENLVAITSLMVLLSVVVQGGWPLFRRQARRRTAEPLPTPPPVAVHVGLGGPLIALTPVSALATAATERITLAEMQQLQAQGEPLVLIDVRTERSYRSSTEMAAGALRIDPDRAVAALRAAGVPQNAWVVAYCT